MASNNTKRHRKKGTIFSFFKNIFLKSVESDAKLTETAVGDSVRYKKAQKNGENRPRRTNSMCQYNKQQK